MSCNITTGQFCVLRLKFVFFHFPPFLSPSIPPFLSRGIILIKHFILDLPLLLLPDVIQAKRSKKNDVIVRLKVMLQNFFVQLDVNCFVLIQLAAIAAAVAAVAADAADIPDICHFWYATIIFRPIKGTPKKCVNSRQKFPRDKTA